MPKIKPGLRAENELYAAADAALRNLRDDLLRRAGLANDYTQIIEFGERLVRYGGRNIAKVAGFPSAAEYTYQAADDLVATPLKEVGA